VPQLWEEARITMTHKEDLPEIERNLDDLRVRHPKAYKQFDEEVRRLKHKTSFAVSMSPVGRAERRP